MKVNILIKDALYMLSADCKADQTYARGISVGVMTVLQSQRSGDFNRAVAEFVKYLPEHIDWKCIPEVWHDDIKEAISGNNRRSVSC